MTHKWHKQNFVLFFNIIALNSNTFVTSVKKLFDASQIEYLWHAVQIRLSGLFDLIIIVEPTSTKVLLQMTTWVEVTGCQVLRVGWM